MLAFHCERHFYRLMFSATLMGKYPATCPINVIGQVL